MKFFGRFALLLVVVYVILTRSWLPPVAFFAGLFASAAGVVVALVYELLSSGVRQERGQGAVERGCRRGAVLTRIGNSMEENILGITKLVNALLGKPALALLSALHIQPENPQYPIPNHIAMELLVFAIAIVFFLWLQGAAVGGQPRRHAAVHGSAAAQFDERWACRILLENNVGHGAEQYLADDRQHRAVRVVLRT